MVSVEHHDPRSVYDAAVDAFAQTLRERAVGIPGALRPWSTLGEEAKDPWRAEAVVYLVALGRAGVGLFRRHMLSTTQPSRGSQSPV